MADEKTSPEKEKKPEEKAEKDSLQPAQKKDDEKKPEEKTNAAEKASGENTAKNAASNTVNVQQKHAEEKKLKFAFKGEVKKELDKQKQQLLAKSEISLLLDVYDDIFSDFDPRPYSQRALSDDFLREARKASYEIKPGVIELRFLIPSSLRKPEVEAMIKKRLREHFRKHFSNLQKEATQIRNKGIFMVALGFMLVLAATYVAPLEQNSFIFRLLFVILEPSGWFTLWFGFDNLFSFANVRKTDLDFYKKMSKAEIVFVPY